MPATTSARRAGSVRVALLTVRAVGTKQRRLVGGFTIATAFLRMWVSKAAMTVPMLPIGPSVLLLVPDRVAPGRATGRPRRPRPGRRPAPRAAASSRR